MPEEEAETVRIAALLHDVGKIGISDRVLRKKKQELAEDELAEYRQHSVRGHDRQWPGEGKGRTGPHPLLTVGSGCRQGAAAKRKIEQH